ncbi:MAG: hypothetical protein IT249_14655 [Chitinophagaceae bacterium]|nr:hypothetical protein [Chitinophagaceae bacterium]
MKKILVTGVGGPTPRSFVRAIKWFGDQYKNDFDFIGTDSNPLAYGLYEKELFSKSYVIPRADTDSEQYWLHINNIIKKENIEAAIILPEIEVLEWAKNHCRLSQKIKLNLPDYELAKQISNKYLLHKILDKTGLIPKFLKVNPGGNNAYDIFKEELGQVFWVRGTQGSSGYGSLKITDENILKQWIFLNSGVKEFIATEYLPGRNLACKLLYFNNKLIASACAERVNYIMSKIAPSGITGNTSFGRLLNEPELVNTSTQTMDIISKKLNTTLNGIFTLDFKEDRNGVPKLTEINIRHVAFTSSLAAGGANIPLQTLKTMFSNKPEEIQTHHFSFEKELVFLRDVDGYPILLNEEHLLKIMEKP